MTNQSILKTSARVKVVQLKGSFVQELRAHGIRHCGADLRPFDPAPTCRFCGEGCGGDCGGL
ncbi:MAG: hypothetical protein Q8S73_42895 [Deltaproteobacteria bacterium]|jgi:hypothetical protein|nr:hypothetical protein [Deltaproteobacteria bacterium]